MDPEDGRVVSNVICQALKREKITIYGEGNQTRSFCYVDDLIDGMHRLLFSDGFQGPVNIGNPDEFTINELAHMVLEKILVILRCPTFLYQVMIPKTKKTRYFACKREIRLVSSSRAKQWT